MKTSPGSVIQQALYWLDYGLSRGQRALRRIRRPRRRNRIAPYRGWATRDKAVVLARVLEDDLDLLGRLVDARRIVRVAYERFATLEVAGAPVRVTWQGRTVETASNTAGFVDLSFLLDGGLPPRTTAADLALIDRPDDETSAAPVYAASPDAELGLISDIDDTVLETELSNPYRRAMQLIFSEQRMRLPFEGIASLYQAFAQPGNPIFYVSNAPWNLYDHLVELLDHHEIPRGPLLLRDIGLVERPPPAAEAGVHKQIALRRILADHPRVRFVLIGDSSRRDPLRYVEVAESHPERVAAIYIRRVTGLLARQEDLGALVARAARAGVELVVASDTVTIAEHAASRGLMVRSEVGHVREGKREDELAPEPEGSLLAPD
jgi:phosphatidate phosphatase APP1